MVSNTAMKTTSGILIIGLFISTACSSAGQSSTALATASPQPTATQIRPLPTPSSPGDSITWDTLQVTMDRLEINDQYMTDYGSTRNPPSGAKFLWVHIQLRNVGQIEMPVPVAEHFSVLYAGTELKPTYGHRQSYTDYTTLGPAIFPDQVLDGWIRFDIPITAELKDLLFVFLPESSQVGASYSSPSYPYADDKPTFVWKCGL
jgi:hypothetical protein